MMLIFCIRIYPKKIRKMSEDGADPSVICHFIEVPDDLFEGFPTTKRYPHQIYYRLAAPSCFRNSLIKSYIWMSIR